VATFSSKDVPGEIIDLLVISAAALKESPALGAALTDAWYNAMKHVGAPRRLLVDERRFT
jgi:NitT/TauT family transport system substrate-binding protein